MVVYGVFSGLQTVTLYVTRDSMSTTTAAKTRTKPKEGFWENRIIRRIRGVKVSFYRRFEGSTLTADFFLKKNRVRRLTDCTVMADAERVAENLIREIQEKSNGLADVKELLALQRAPTATVEDVHHALDAGDIVLGDKTLSSYKGKLRMLAETVDENRPLKLDLGRVLTREVLDAFVAARQGGKRVNRRDKLKANTGINTVIRELKAMFRKHRTKMSKLKLPDLAALLEYEYLPEPDHRFVQLPAEDFRAMCEASRKLKTAWPELWLVHMAVRLLGLRNEELMSAKRHWLETRDGETYLVIKERPGEFSLLKHGLPGSLWVDPDLAVEWLKRENGYLILPEGTDTQRFDLIYRDHNNWLREFIPRSERQKGAHELRKHVGSVLLTTHGADAAQRYLRQKSRRVFEDHYADWIKPLPRVTMEMAGESGIAAV